MPVYSEKLAEAISVVVVCSYHLSHTIATLEGVGKAISVHEQVLAI